ncbi:MAG TPA: hypothetical protein DCY12_05460 [Candidatus Atribacteria bacterium]|nr:hypothetical protein [Candidatus Atribacteria bacterium]
MRTIIILVMIFLSGSCFAGDKVYTDDDLKQYGAKEIIIDEQTEQNYVIKAAMAIKTMLKNPRSFDLDGYKIVDKGGGRIGVYIFYYGQNVYGGLILNTTLVIFYGDEIEQIIDL